MSSRRRALPTATSSPWTFPVIPLPVMEVKSVAVPILVPRSLAPLTIACASGCSLAFSKAAAGPRRVWMSKPWKGSTVISFGLPSVRVPVLSTTSVSIFSSVSSASALRIKMPAIAPRPVPTMIDIGVARPSAQGHAMMRTATALTSACAILGSGPYTAQIANVAIATPITMGTNQPDT